MSKHFLPGSARRPLAGATLAGPADPGEWLEVTLLLRHNDFAGLQDRVKRLSQGDYSLAPLSREKFLASHGAREDDVEAVSKFAAQHELSVVSVDRARRSIVLSGVVKNFDAAFGVKLQHYTHENGSYRGREGEITLPDNLKDVVQAVLGLDNRPQARAHFRTLTTPKSGTAPQPVSYTPPKIAALYGFPGATGAGQTIAVLELGGGSRSADLREYFKSLELKAPALVSVSVDRARNHPTGSDNGPDGEVMLDIEVAGAVAPDAALVVYFAPNTDAGFLDAVTTAIHDTTHKPSVLSISWGGPESNWTAQAMTALDQAFQDAAALGVTVCIASGDGGSTDGVSSGNHVDFPASSPHVLACGGTRLVAENGAISSETVWNDLPDGGASGGGVSSFFALPVWQAGRFVTSSAGVATELTKRGVPDVAGNADPQTGYAVRVDGQNTVIGGTSAVAPLWAGLIAQINELRAQASFAPVGFLNPILYQGKTALNDIEHGTNGAFAASEGWDACTGLGSPDGKALAARLVNDIRGSSAQTASGDALRVKGNAYLKQGNELIQKGQAFIDQANAVQAGPNAMIAGPHAMIAGHHAMIAGHHAMIAGHHAMIAGHHAMIAGPHAEAAEGDAQQAPSNAPQPPLRPGRK